MFDSEFVPQKICIKRNLLLAHKYSDSFLWIVRKYIFKDAMCCCDFKNSKNASAILFFFFSLKLILTFGDAVSN